MLRATARLRDCRITFFTRSPCGLCDTAKAVVQNVRAKRPLDYTEINVMEPPHEKWREVYEFDTPVVHIDKAGAPETTTSSSKLMHRFTEEDVFRKMDEAERS
ncbi:glutaredoxin 2 [Plenodomus tracheiphilus IPT5]|uniref:Glutaredoxin-like protein n=1 Tax=Plenodomus tracheiphilus IPT5 TaxID=1408161 RepID=A0A6A7BL16_9PLEO|nr:glutaredoxin 2 [Plenodomus tracheiphilus IPT5]